MQVTKLCLSFLCLNAVNNSQYKHFHFKSLRFILALSLLIMLLSYTSQVFCVRKGKNDYETKDSYQYNPGLLKNNEKFIRSLQGEYSSFLKKYEKHSCIMNVFNKANLNCKEDHSDEVNSKFAYLMTQCFYESVGKKLPHCSKKISLEEEKTDSSKINLCVRNLSGDAWTTYVSFLNQIENLCFFHKTLLWEKSSEFLFSKMLNSSLGIISELSNGSHLARKILLEQENFSRQLKDNMTDTLLEFKKIQNQFESLEKLEEKIQKDLFVLEDRVKQNNDKILKTFENISNKINTTNNKQGYFFNSSGEFLLSFYLFLFAYVWILALKKNIEKIKFYLYLYIITLFILEKYLFANIHEAYAESLENFDSASNSLAGLLNSGDYDLLNNQRSKNKDFNLYNKNNNNNNNNYYSSSSDKSNKFNNKTGPDSLYTSTSWFSYYFQNFFINKMLNYFKINFFEYYFGYFIFYFFRAFGFAIINLICYSYTDCQDANSNSNYYCNDGRNSFKFNNNNKSQENTITPLWMKKYYNRIEYKNQELLERFQSVKNKIQSYSQMSTPNFKNKN